MKDGLRTVAEAALLLCLFAITVLIWRQEYYASPLVVSFADNAPSDNLAERLRGIFENRTTGTTLLSVARDERLLTFRLASAEFDYGAELTSGPLTRIPVGRAVDSRPGDPPRDQGRPYVLVVDADHIGFGVCSSRRYSFAQRLVDVTSSVQARAPEFVCYSLASQLHAAPIPSAL